MSPTTKRIRAEITGDKHCNKKTGGSYVDLQFRLEDGTNFFRRLYLRRPNGRTTIAGTSVEIPGLIMYKKLRMLLKCPVGPLVGASLMLHMVDSVNAQKEPVRLLLDVSAVKQPTLSAPKTEKRTDQTRTLMIASLGLVLMGTLGYIAATYVAS